MNKLKRCSLVIVVSLIIGTIVIGSGVHYHNQIYVQKVIKAIQQEDITQLQSLMEYPLANLNSKPRSWIYQVMNESVESTPLEVACKIGNPEIVKMLIENGANVNYIYWDRSRSQGSPLMNAASSLSEKRLEVIRLLIEHGADVRYEDTAGNDVLSCVVYSSLDRDDTIETIAYLEQAGVNIYKKYGSSQDTLLHKACERNSFEVVKYLIEQRGFDVNAVNADGDTALIYFLRFASHREKEILLFLMQSGADLEIKNKDGKTAHDYATERHPELIELLSPKTN